MAPLTFRRLRFWNIGAAALQLITGIAILGMTDYDAKSKLPWYTFFISSWSRDDNAAGFYVPAPKQVASFPTGVWSGVFLLLSAADHLLVSLPRVNSVYNRLLCANRNPFRWAEYSVSASLMTVMIAQLSGVTDIHLLFTLAALMASTMLFGWQMEVANGRRIPAYQFTSDSRLPPAELPPSKGVSVSAAAGVPASFISNAAYAPGPADASFGAEGPAGPGIQWGPFLMGCWPFVACYAVIACYFFQAVANGDPPGFVWAIFFILLILYCLFAVNQVLQFKQVRGWRGFATAEWWYILLSLTSKQLLAWIAYGGTKRFASEGN